MSETSVVVLPNPEAVADAAAELVIEQAAEAIARRGQFAMALAGGSTPKRLYQLLAEPQRRERCEWSRWQLFFGDERAVPPTADTSNYRMAHEALLSRVPLADEQVHRMRGELPADEAAHDYARQLDGQRLDLVLLGMGDDGHTASLFPGRPELELRDRWVTSGRAPVTPHERITLTLAALEEAELALFLVTGGSKAARVAEVLRQRREGTPELPAARVTPRRGALFYLDSAAASEVHETPPR